MKLDFYKMAEFTAIEEGFRRNPYKDSVGVWTIGYGSTKLYYWNELFKNKWVKVTQDTKPISRDSARINLILGLDRAYRQAKEYVNNFNDLSGVRQCVLIMMAYQLGGAGLRGFTETKKYIEDVDFVKASDEMLDSKWFKEDSPQRAARTSKIFLSNSWCGVRR